MAKKETLIRISPELYSALIRVGLEVGKNAGQVLEETLRKDSRVSKELGPVESEPDAPVHIVGPALRKKQRGTR